MPRFWFVVFIFSLITINSVSADNDVITFVFMSDPDKSPVYRFAELLYKDAFGRLNIDFKYKVYPPLRGAMVLNDGEADGDPARNEYFNQTYKNLLRVDEEVFTDRIIVIAKNPDLNIESWEVLYKSDYRIEYYRGIDAAEKKLAHKIVSEKLSTISSPEQSLKKLLAGRIDLYIDAEARVLELLEKPEYKNTGLKISGCLGELHNYPYLHKKHAALVPELSSILKEMKKEGKFVYYYKTARQMFYEK